MHDATTASQLTELASTRLQNLAKVRAIEMHRVKVIEALLLQIDGAGMSSNHPVLRYYTKVSAGNWRSDPSSATDIEARLERFGCGLLAIYIEGFVQAQPGSILFDILV